MSIGLRCPKCTHPDTKITDSRPKEAFAACHRRRMCHKCGFRFGTVEIEAEAYKRLKASDGAPVRARRVLLKAIEELDA